MKRLAIALVAVFAIFASSCMVGPKYQAPAMPAPPAFKELDGWKTAQPADTKLRGDWWEMFGDAELNALEQQVNTSNQSLKIEVARFEQARALIKFNRAAKYPSVTIGTAVSANRYSANGALASPADTVNYGDFELPLQIDYEVDAFGRIHHAIEAARNEAQATEADLETLRLSLHAELAYDYFELRGLDAEQKLLDDTVVAYTKALELTRNRYEGGATSGAEVAQAQTQLDGTRTQDKDIGVQRAAYEHAIAVLVGKAPAELSLNAKPLSIGPPEIPFGVPSQLLERRPDIAAAERRVAEANAQVGIARAAYFPTILISAAVGLEGSSITNWLVWPSRFWAVGPSVLQTVFDGGRRRANSEIAREGYDATIAAYRQTSLDAFQQVEDNLAALRILNDEAGTQREAVEAAQRSLQLSMNRYVGGIVTYLEVVTAQTVALENERTAVDIARRRMDASVSLIKALGGGWDVSQLPKLNG